MPDFEHVFFDLDRTLWDFDRNSRETLGEVFEAFDLKHYYRDESHFIDLYEQINERFWELYKRNRVSKEQLRTGRFEEVLSLGNCNTGSRARDISQFYIENSPAKKHLIPGAAELLKALHGKTGLHIITNGFDEVQHFKLKNCGIRDYFEAVITSDAAGAKKPQIEIFLYALEKAGAEARHSLMVGDDPHSDIMGARGAGMAQAFFNASGVRGSDREIYIEYAHHNELAEKLQLG